MVGTVAIGKGVGDEVTLISRSIDGFGRRMIR